MENNLQKIKDEYAREKGYKDWKDYSIDGAPSFAVDEIASRFAAKQCDEMRKDVVEFAMWFKVWGFINEDGTIDIKPGADIRGKYKINIQTTYEVFKERTKTQHYDGTI
jgi:hypothetical protein